MKRRIQFDPEVLASRYIAQLETDLKLERERIKVYRADVEFYRGKCEKLELAILETSPSGSAQSFVKRADPRRPSIMQTKLENTMKPKFQELRKKWDSLSAEDQEKIVETGEWNVGETEPATKG